MAELAVLKVSTREGRGTRKAEKLRKDGRVPGVVYGHKQETLSVSVARDDLVAAIRHGARVVDLHAESAAPEKAQILEVQWDPLGQDVLHVDFLRVSADERIHVPVRIEVRGIAPGVTGGGVLDQPLHTLEVECPAVSVPDSIRVNVGELQLGSVIHVRDLVLPPDVKAMGDPDAVVVQVIAKMVEPEPTAVPPVGEQAEPELVGRKKPAEEEEGE